MKRTQHYVTEIAQKKKDFYYELTEVELKQIKQCFLDIYKDVAEFCKVHNLIVMVAGGTAIGAVRHHGYIPWDDDFDMMMPRKDYMTFIKLFEKEYGDKYYISSPEHDEGDSSHLFLKVFKRGTSCRKFSSVKPEWAAINVDIYPIDFMPNNKLWRNIKCKLLDLVRILAISVSSFYMSRNPQKKAIFMISFKHRMYYYTRWLLGFICSIYSRNNWYLLHSKLSSSIETSNWCSLPTCDLAINELEPKNVFFPPKEAIFEGIKVNIPNDVDAYLRKLYGDYMQIPPIDKRERHYYLEKPFFGDK